MATRKTNNTENTTKETTKMRKSKNTNTEVIVSEEVNAPAVVEEAVVVEDKAVVEVPAVVEDKVETVTNSNKVNQYLTIEDVAKLYEELGIKCKNPNAKGNYRIMGGGSSLNLKPKKGYYIYSSDVDLDNIVSSEFKASDLIVEKGTNAQDKTRPNTIICTSTETLRELLKLYTINPLNKAQ